VANKFKFDIQQAEKCPMENARSDKCSNAEKLMQDYLPVKRIPGAVTAGIKILRISVR
jgi:hypothetical protein